MNPRKHIERILYSVYSVMNCLIVTKNLAPNKSVQESDKQKWHLKSEYRFIAPDEYEDDRKTSLKNLFQVILVFQSLQDMWWKNIHQMWRQKFSSHLSSRKTWQAKKTKVGDALKKNIICKF